MRAVGSAQTRKEMQSPRPAKKFPSRRQFLVRAGQFTALALPGRWAFGSTANTGAKTTIAEAFDREMDEFMAARNVPGGALAVIKDQRLVYARGYGWADHEEKEA